MVCRHMKRTVLYKWLSYIQDFPSRITERTTAATTSFPATAENIFRAKASEQRQRFFMVYIKYKRPLGKST